MTSQNFEDAWAVTMFSFANELLAAEKTPLQLVESVLEAGLTKNIEIDGPMHFHNWPHVPSSEISELKALLAKYGARIAIIGGAIDRSRSASVFVSSEEAMKLLEAQIALAKELGAFGVRLMVGALSLEEAKHIAPIAEQHGIKIMFELHGVLTADSADAQAVLAFVKEVNSPWVTLMFDSSLFMLSFPEAMQKIFVKIGVAPGKVSEIVRRWSTDSLSEFKGWLLPQIEGGEFPPQFGAYVATLFTRMGHAKPEDYDAYLPYIECVHLKYWELVDTDGEISKPTKALIDYLRRKNYQGFFISEYGGHEWASVSEISALAMTAGHRALVEAVFN
jgi:sugar phosphate isomerase/epimerase